VIVLVLIIMAIAAIGGLYLIRTWAAKGPPARPKRVLSQSRVIAPTEFSSPPVADAAATAPELVMPAKLAEFSFLGRDSLTIEHRQALVAQLRTVPRPPLSLYKLVSAEFLDSATSSEISDLIMGEALIAAQVLARVNSPFYGLRTPVLSIGQAVTFIGLNAVRSICLRYMLAESFKATSVEHRLVFDRVLAASAMANEMCFTLSHQLNMPEQGSLVTQVVLSFLGHLAAVSLMPIDSLLWTDGNGLIERANAEQSQLGLSATEIGSLLMEEWGLPISLIQEVSEIDRILLLPVAAIEPSRGARLALCYLCARLGERLALGSLSNLAEVDLASDSSAEFFHLRAYLELPRLARLNEFLHSAELVKSIEHMQLAARLHR